MCVGKVSEIAVKRGYGDRASDELYIETVELVGVDEEYYDNTTVFRVYKKIKLPMDSLTVTEFQEAINQINAWISEDRKIFETVKKLSEAFNIPIKLASMGDC
jgi:hypothetical protein